jgi:hypothetical protein
MAADKEEPVPAIPPPADTPAQSLLDFVKSVPGSRVAGVTFSDGERWEFGPKGEVTKYRPQ